MLRNYNATGWIKIEYYTERGACAPLFFLFNTQLSQIAAEYMKSNSQFNEDLMKHISPLNWEHINFLGEYKFEVKEVGDMKELRPLRLFETGE